MAPPKKKPKVDNEIVPYTGAASRPDRPPTALDNGYYGDDDSYNNDFITPPSSPTGVPIRQGTKDGFWFTFN